MRVVFLFDPEISTQAKYCNLFKVPQIKKKNKQTNTVFQKKACPLFYNKLYMALLRFSEFIPTSSSSRFTENILHLEDIAQR